MKRVITVLVAAPLLVGLAACSDSSKSSSPTVTDAVTTPSVVETDAPETTEPAVETTEVDETTTPATDAPVTSDGGITIATDELGLPVIGNTYTNAEGGYSISFPGTPTEQDVPAPGTGVTAKAAVYETSDGAYAVIYFDVPNATGADVETLLKAVLNGSASNIGISELTFTPIDLNGNAGLRGEGSGGGAEIIADTYLVGTRLYEVFYVGDASVGNPLAGGVLSTFELLG